MHNLVDAAQAVVDGRIPAVSLGLAEPAWVHSRISDSLTDKLQVAIKEAAVLRPPLTHVALRFGGKVWALPRPYRHHHIRNVILMLDHDVHSVDCRDEDQGFLDESGRYLNRRQAEVSAFLNEQVKNGKLIGGPLTSEDLW
jgi:hypothetical protein